VLAIFLVPLFFVVILGVFRVKPRRAEDGPVEPHAPEAAP
jgi:hypothetical protein